MTQHILTIAELAVALSVSTRHLERCRANGMPSVLVGTRARRYDMAACIAWMQSQDPQSGQEQPCPSTPRQTAATKSPSASAVNAYTDAYRRAQLRVMPSAQRPS